MTIDLAEVQAIAESIARAAGEVILTGAKDVRDDVMTKTSPMDVVTSVDMAVEKLIVARITATFPHDAILGEEGASRSGTTGRRWIIDPIDGTINFVRGRSASAVSIGVEVDGEFAVGAIYDPFHDELFSAATGMGAFRNGQRIPRRVASPPIAEAFVGLIGGYMRWARVERAAVASRLMLHAGDTRYIGSMALDLCHAAVGRLDACFANGYSAWDLAAGAVIAREAGYIVNELPAGSTSTGKRALALPGLMPEFRALVEEGLVEATTSRAMPQPSIG